MNSYEKEETDQTLARIITSSASQLPIECQEWLLILAKGMSLAKKITIEEIKSA